MPGHCPSAVGHVLHGAASFLVQAEAFGVIPVTFPIPSPQGTACAPVPPQPPTDTGTCHAETSLRASLESKGGAAAGRREAGNEQAASSAPSQQTGGGRPRAGGTFSRPAGARPAGGGAYGQPERGSAPGASTPARRPIATAAVAAPTVPRADWLRWTGSSPALCPRALPPCYRSGRGCWGCHKASGRRGSSSGCGRCMGAGKGQLGGGGRGGAGCRFRFSEIGVNGGCRDA